MTERYDDLCQALTMTEIIQLQSMLSLALRQRFERKAAIAFSDIVGSTRYFATFGDEAGRRLQQRHVDLLQRALSPGCSRIVDTAGDGALLFFDDVTVAAGSLVAFMRHIATDNADRERDHRLAVRIGIHYGSVLTDGVQVTGDAVNVCSRVASSAEPGEIRLTRDAFNACVETTYRCKCRVLQPVTVKGVAGAVEVLTLAWRDEAVVPTRVRFDTGEEHPLPDHEIITFGRQRAGGTAPANDIVLQCADPALTRAISRWHFQLMRRPDRLVLRALADAPTEVNGRPVAKGEEVAIWPGDTVRVSNVLTLRFSVPDLDGDRTIQVSDQAARQALEQVRQSYGKSASFEK